MTLANSPPSAGFPGTELKVTLDLGEGEGALPASGAEEGAVCAEAAWGLRERRESPRCKGF